MIQKTPHLIAIREEQSDGMGGTIGEAYRPIMVVHGVLDLLEGSDRANEQNALTENSTHVLVVLEYTEGITDQMCVVDRHGRVYDITYSDDPADQQNHNELLLSLVQGKTHEWSEDDG